MTGTPHAHRLTAFIVLVPFVARSCRGFGRRVLSGLLWAAGAVFVMAMLICIPYGAQRQPLGAAGCWWWWVLAASCGNE